jgi:hypothetical protein
MPTGIIDSGGNIANNDPSGNWSFQTPTGIDYSNIGIDPTLIDTGSTVDLASAFADGSFP